MTYNTEAIVIRSQAYGETHAIITLLTPSGTVGAMARGAKKPQSRLAACVQLCVEGVYTLSQRSGLATVLQAEVTHVRRSLHADLTLAAYAAYFCELATRVAEPRPHGSEALYRGVRGVLDRLEGGADPRLTARMFESKALAWLGAAPDWSRCVACSAPLREEVWYSARDGGLLCAACRSRHAPDAPGFMHVSPTVPRLLSMMTVTPWERLGRLQLSELTARQLQLVLRTQMEDFAGLHLKSRRVLDQLIGK